MTGFFWTLIKFLKETNFDYTLLNLTTMKTIFLFRNVRMIFSALYIFIATLFLASCQNQPEPQMAAVKPCEHDTIEFTTDFAFKDCLINPEMLNLGQTGDYLVIEPTGIVKNNCVMQKIVQVIDNHRDNSLRILAVEIKHGRIGDETVLVHRAKVFGFSVAHNCVYSQEVGDSCRMDSLINPEILQDFTNCDEMMYIRITEKVIKVINFHCPEKPLEWPN